MKNKILFVSLLSFLSLCSCSDRTEEVDLSTTDNNTRNITSAAEEEGLTADDLEERNVYIDENYELFEDIRVFDSSEELSFALFALDAMNYIDLRNWCTSNNFHNSILESKIVYDSVFSSVLEEFGYSYDEYLDNEDYTLDNEYVFETFKERMIREYPHYINILEEYDEEYGTEYYIEPFSTDGFDELIFMNNKNIVIVGLNVYKLVGGVLLSTSVYNFNEEFANLTNTESADSYLASPNIGENVFYSILNSNSNNSELLPIKWIVKGNRTKMKVKLNAYDSPNWKGDIIRHARLSVSNYRCGCWKKVYTTINVTADLIGIEDGEGVTPFYFQDEGKFWLRTGRKKHMMHSPLGSNQIYLNNISGNVENSWGLNVNF